MATGGILQEEAKCNSGGRLSLVRIGEVEAHLHAMLDIGQPS
jgi:hypothetical protein